MDAPQAFPTPNLADSAMKLDGKKLTRSFGRAMSDPSPPSLRQ